MDLSIIIPLYNCEKYIKDCLSTLVNQGIDTGRFEIIIIDDGSKDNSLNVVKDFVINNPNVCIHIIQQENQGVSVARNAGIDHACGTYIYFVDADDYLAHNTLDKMLDDILERNLQVLYFECIRTNKRYIYSSKNLDTYKFDKKVYKGIDFIANYPSVLGIWKFIVKKDFILHNNLRLLKELLIAEDALFIFELVSVAEKVSSTNLDVYRYYQNPKSIVHNKEMSHRSRLVKDLKYFVIKLGELIDKIDSRNKNADKCIERLKGFQHFYVYKLIVKQILSPMKYCDFKDSIYDLKNLGIYPITHYPGKIKVHIFNKVAVYFLNKLFLLLPFVYILKTLNMNMNKYLSQK